MKKDQPLYFRKRHKYLYFLTLGVTIILFFIFTSLIVLDGIPVDFDSEKTQTDQDTNNVSSPESDSDLINLNGTKFTFDTTQFVATLKYNQKSNELFTCETENATCAVLQLETITGNPAIVMYISHTDKVISNSSAQTKELVQKINYKGVEKDFVFYNLEVFDEQGKPLTDKIITEQIVGCVSRTLCINSGILSLNYEENARQVDLFKNFINSIDIK